MSNISARRLVQALTAALLLAIAAPHLSATTIFFSGNLRTDANVTSCGGTCTLGPMDDDATYAQFAAVVDTFTVYTPSTMSAVTYSYGGGTSLTGAMVANGGLEPYLSLFGPAGNFITSSYYGTSCPAGAGTYQGFCYDTAINGGTLAPGTYSIALTAYNNYSFAEQDGPPLTLADGFLGLGNLYPGEDLHYGFDVVLTPQTVTTTPEPNFAIPTGIAFAALFFFHKKMKLGTHQHI